MKYNTWPGRKIRQIAWTLFLLVFIAYIFVAFFTGSGTGISARDIFYEIMGFLTVSTLVFTAFKIGGKDRRLWTFVAAAGVFWMLGDLTYRGAEIMGLAGAHRVLSPPDFFYILSYASMICTVQAFASLVRKKASSGFDWTRFYAPGVAILAFLVSGALAMIMPNGMGTIGTANPQLSISRIVDFMYPGLDIGILAGLLLVILTHNSPFRQAWQGIGVFGLALFTLADINYSLAEQAAIYTPENIVSRMIIALWILGDILILMSAIYRLTGVSEGLTVSGEIADDALLIPD